MELYTAKEIKQKYKITNQTLYNWRKGKKIKYKVMESGRYMYIDNELGDDLKKRHVIYGRVSNTKQKHDLERQIEIIREYVVKNGVIVDEIYSDIASGMNENRKNFNKLLDEIIDGNIETVYVSYKDRLTRFGFGYFERLFQKFGTKIEVVNLTDESSFQQELTEDLISIIHHFSMKIYSNRRKGLKEIERVLKTDVSN